MVPPLSRISRGFGLEEGTSVGGLGRVEPVCQDSLMSRTSTSTIGRDAGLQARMLLTMFLLGLLYVVFVGVLIAAGAGAVIVALFAGGFLLLQFFTSDKLALRAMGAQARSRRRSTPSSTR